MSTLKCRVCGCTEFAVTTDGICICRNCHTEYRLLKPSTYSQKQEQAVQQNNVQQTQIQTNTAQTQGQSTQQTGASQDQRQTAQQSAGAQAHGQTAQMTAAQQQQQQRQAAQQLQMQASQMAAVQQQQRQATQMTVAQQAQRQEQQQPFIANSGNTIGNGTGNVNVNIVNYNQTTKTNNAVRRTPDKSPKKWGVTRELCRELGFLGAHRFYVGKYGTGLLWLCTFGLLGIGWFYDLWLISQNKFTDADGKIIALI